jgi:6-phosphogluconate dehydrogenase
MLPAGDVTEALLEELLPTLAQGDIIIDGGNSHFTDTLRRHASVEARGLHFLDAGVSGGTLAAKIGYCTMIGGTKEVFDHAEPIFRDMSVQDGYLYCGPSGSGHYTKMVHNAIEYAQMQAIGEGFEILKSGHYKHMDLKAIAKLYCNGSIIRGYLMDCTLQALEKDPELAKISDFIEDNGEGQWTVQEALKHQIPFLSGTHALYSRYLSRQEESFAYKIVAAQRFEFGGHKMKEK